MRHNSKREVAIVLLILAVAAFFRFYHLDRTPPGLYPDEAMNGSNALIANETGDYDVFYPENNGREGLFINLQAMSVKWFGAQSWALRGVSALIGVLTVLGLYLLTRELFDRHIAALSSFLMAISFWHVNFSRIGFRAIMLPFILVFMFYFFWRGLKESSFPNFLWAGVFAGLGFHTYTSYRIAPLIVLAVLFNYWLFLKKDYAYAAYAHARNRLIGGIALMAIAAFLVVLPLGLYYLSHPEFAGARGGISVFAQSEPWRAMAASFSQTLGMFTFNDDCNWRHNLACSTTLAWPIAGLFAIGFIKELWHWLSRKHGHFSPTHTLLFAWFLIMLLPGMLSIEAPHALRTVGAIPVVMIFAGLGLWWIFKLLGAWYDHQYSGAVSHVGRAPIPAVWVLVILLGAMAIFEYNRYFNIWGGSPHTAGAFTQEYVHIADQINALPQSVKKYVIVRAGGVEVYGVPMPAQTVMFLTQSASQEAQREKNIFYLTPGEARQRQFERNARIFEIK